jgi:sterol desaturase/sphingolipid hydroxylase (fatty acid hydroxylase superfamily)
MITTEQLYLTALSLLIGALMFIPLEKVFPARTGQRIFRPAWRLDFLYFLGQYLVWSVLSFSFFQWFSVQVIVWIPASTQSWVIHHPLLWRAPIALVAGDVLVYWFHRASHHYPWLWRFHAVHHSAEHLDWLAAFREHPVDGILTQFFQNLPFFLLGVSPTLVAGLIVFRGTWGLFIHSNVALPLGPLSYLVGSPALHHWHHLQTPVTNHNFSNLAPWLDVVFGTHHHPEGPEKYPLGLTEPFPKDYVWQLLLPLFPTYLSNKLLKNSNIYPKNRPQTTTRTEPPKNGPSIPSS